MTQEVIRLADNPSLKSVKETVLAVLRAVNSVFKPGAVTGSAIASSAVRRLVSAKGRRRACPVAIPGYHVLRSYSPNIDDITARLARRCWPGPITLVADASDPRSRFASLSDDVKEVIMPRGTVGYRVPNHPLFLEILRELDEPLLLTSANLTGEPPAVNAESAKVGLEDCPTWSLTSTAVFSVHRLSRSPTERSMDSGKGSHQRPNSNDGEDDPLRLSRNCQPNGEVICANLIARKIGCVLMNSSHGYV